MKRKTKNIVIIILIILTILSVAGTMFYAKNHLITSSSNEINLLNNTTPPEKPSDDDSATIPEKPSDDDIVTPPEKPSNDNNSSFNNTSSNNQKSNLNYCVYVLFGVESFIISILIMYIIMSKFNKKSIKEIFNTFDKITIYILSIIILTGVLTFINIFITTNFIIDNNSSTFNSEGQTQSDINYSSNKKITSSSSITSGSFDSSESDENALLISGSINVSLLNISVSKTGDSNTGDNTSFYGTNSAITAKDGANLKINKINVSTNATGANGVFSYGGQKSDGTTINISDSTITTTKDSSGGIMITGGGIMNASNLTINTSGTSSAAIRSDRGGGTVNVDGGIYTTSGQGSPAIYSTAEVLVKNADLISTNSEGIVIEGKNSVTLENVNLTDTNIKLNGLSTTYKNIFLYQSMSGDAEEGCSEFTSNNSKIITNKGDSFYITNTTAIINLTNNEIINNDEEGYFLRTQKDSWGRSGSNGGNVTLNLNKQSAVGNIAVDSISTLILNIKESSYYEGAINNDNNAKSISLVLDKTSKIKLTNDSYIFSLDNADSSNSNIDFNGYKLYVNGESIN